MALGAPSNSYDSGTLGQEDLSYDSRDNEEREALWYNYDVCVCVCVPRERPNPFCKDVWFTLASQAVVAATKTYAK